MHSPAYLLNGEHFVQFHALQSDLSHCLARHPEAIRAWLRTQPIRSGGSIKPGKASKSWRMARLSAARRHELEILLERSTRSEKDRAPLARWLLAAVPVQTYFEIVDQIHPDVLNADPEAEQTRRRLMAQRDALFHSNYGLAKSAVRGRDRPDYDDRLSAASCGLLDAIDRYVPGPKAARFGYFASYWIRYHLSRHNQKFHSLITIPIHQYRIGRKLDRSRAATERAGERPLSIAEQVPAFGLDARMYLGGGYRPTVTSIHAPVGSGDSPAMTMEHLLEDPEPGPLASVESADMASHLLLLIKTTVSPGVRVMLAASRGLGSLPEACEDYLAHLHEQMRRSYV